MTKTTCFIPALLSFLGLFAFTNTAFSQDTESPKPILSKKKLKNDFKAIKFYVDFKAFNHQFQTNFDNSNGIKADVQKLKHTGFSTSLGYSKTLKQNRFF